MLSDPQRPEPGMTYKVTKGASFSKTAEAKLHTLRYSFKPQSVSKASKGRLQVNGHEAILTSDGPPKVVFEGNVESHKTSEFALICDADGSWRLERLGSNIKNLMVQRDATSKAANKARASSAALQTSKSSSRRPARASTPTAGVSGAAAAADACVDDADLFGDSD